MSKLCPGCFLLFLGVILFATIEVNAQNRDRPTWLSITMGHHEYRGDLGNEMLGFNLGYDWTLGVALDQYLNNYLDLEVSGLYGELDYDIFFNTSFLNSQGVLRYKPIRDRYRIDPFIGTGLGITLYWNKDSDFQNGTTFHLPLQMGFDLKLTNRLSSTFNATYNRTFSDDIDGSDFGSRSHDDFMIYSVGIKFSLNKTRDSDGDGVSNKDDLCPNKYGKSFWGCPDSDGDSLYDNEDNCPTVPGSPLLNGCPDSDNDGVDNSRDQCPDVQGPFRFNGCPDDDNDGIPNRVDECPDRAGRADTNGCPQNGDTTTEINRLLDSDMESKLSEIAGNISFEAGSSSLDSLSQQNLDRLADIMLDDGALQLIIRSYTDNTGNPNDNLELSVKRANAVKTYLVEKGLENGRLYAFGYGEQRPVASNDTPEGREQNRRIELHLYYK